MGKNGALFLEDRARQSEIEETNFELQQLESQVEAKKRKLSDLIMAGEKEPIRSQCKIKNPTNGKDK